MLKLPLIYYSLPDQLLPCKGTAVPPQPHVPDTAIPTENTVKNSDPSSEEMTVSPLQVFEAVPRLVSPTYCSPILDMDELCHCLRQDSIPHAAFLPVPPGFALPPCLLYIDDSLLAVLLYLNRFCVKLLPTAGPSDRLLECGLGIPGTWNLSVTRCE